MSQTLSVWDGYVIHSPAELRTCLEDYTYHHEQGAPGNGGDEVGSPERWDREGRLMAQNRMIDRGMMRLLHADDEDRLWWKVLNLYYRQGMWVERRGWIAPAKVLGMEVPVCLSDARCRIPGDDRLHIAYCGRGDKCRFYRDRFEEALDASIDALFAVLDVRSRRKV